MKALNILHSETLDRIETAKSHYEADCHVYQELCNLENDYLPKFFVIVGMLDELPVTPSDEYKTISDFAEFYNWKLALFRQVRERVTQIAGHVP